MIQRSMLGMVNNRVHNKVKRLIKQGIIDREVLFQRTMESVNKPQVQALIGSVGLEPLVVEGYVREIINDELKKPAKINIITYYMDIGMVCIGSVLVSLNIGVMIAVIVKYFNGYGFYNTETISFRILAGIILIIIGIRGIKKHNSGDKYWANEANNIDKM